MSWLIYLHVGLSFLAIPVTLAITYVAWRRRRTPGIFSFFLFMLTCSVWAVSEFFSTVAPTERLAFLFQVPFRMSAVSLVPLGFLAFSLEYTGRWSWLQGWRLAAFALIPAITQVIVWTPLYPLVIEAIPFAHVGPLLLRQGADFGPWFEIHRTYSYILVGLSLLLILGRIVQSQPFYRRQATILFLGMVLAVGANAIANATLPVPGDGLWLDWTPPSLALSGLMWSWALFRVGLLDVMPVALDAVFNCMEEVVIVLDERHVVVDVNPAGSRLLGRARREVAGVPLAELSGPLAAAIRSHAGDQRSEVAAGGRVLELMVSPLLTPRAEVVGQLAVLHDITERAQLIHDLDAYARTVAHDLKNPLSVIGGYVGLLREREADLDPDAREHLGRIDGTSRKMGNIINSLLLLANVRRTAQVEMTRLDMGLVLDNALRRYEMQIASAGASVTMPDAWPSACGYADWVEEIWANYLSNALKYGGTPPRIEIGASASKGMARFWVRDNGQGLSAEARDRLFREFVRLDHQHADGHGLGLSIVARIAKRLGGDAGVESQPGGGSLFWFTLPSAV